MDMLSASPPTFAKLRTQNKTVDYRTHAHLRFEASSIDDCRLTQRNVVSPADTKREWKHAGGDFVIGSVMIPDLCVKLRMALA